MILKMHKVRQSRNRCSWVEAFIKLDRGIVKKIIASVEVAITNIFLRHENGGCLGI
jgi:hypothetical protein